MIKTARLMWSDHGLRSIASKCPSFCPASPIASRRASQCSELPALALESQEAKPRSNPRDHKALKFKRLLRSYRCSLAHPTAFLRFPRCSCKTILKQTRAERLCPVSRVEIQGFRVLFELHAWTWSSFGRGYCGVCKGYSKQHKYHADGNLSPAAPSRTAGETQVSHRG